MYLHRLFMLLLSPIPLHMLCVLQEVSLCTLCHLCDQVFPDAHDVHECGLTHWSPSSPTHCVGQTKLEGITGPRSCPFLR